jgi:8-oxo-dGTP diphosphatase
VAVSPVVRAAGGIVSRANDRGELEVLLVYRTAHDDWTFPKGKALLGETDEACALREVEEETGLRCAIQAEVGEARYRDGAGRQKVVRYWAMRAVAGVAAARAEIDAVRWAGLPAAARLLTYERDREVLAAFANGRGP